jgi:hypothetical protein
MRWYLTAAARRRRNEAVKPRCDECGYFDPSEHPKQEGCEQLGLCRKSAPARLDDGFGGFAWPVVRDRDWCGQFATLPRFIAECVRWEVFAGRLPTRAINALESLLTPRTVRRLCELTESDLLEYRNVGHSTLEDIKAALSDFGLHLKE